MNHGDLQGVKLYPKAKKEMDKESDKLDVSVSNAEDIIDRFISLANKQVWGRLGFMVETGTGPNKLIRQVQQIHIADIHYQACEYFGLLGIRNVGNNVFPNPSVVSDLQNLNGDPQKKLMLHQRGY